MGKEADQWATVYEERLDAFLKVLGLERGEYTGEKSGERIKLEDNIAILPEYVAGDSERLNIRIVKDDTSDFLFGFVLRRTGLEYIGSMFPSISLGEEKLKLRTFGIGGEMQQLKFADTEKEQEDNFTINLIDWVEKSISEKKLQPLNIQINFLDNIL